MLLQTKTVQNVYFERTLHVIRATAIVVPVFIVIAGLLVRAGILDRTYYSSDAVFFSIGILFLLFSFFQLLPIAQSFKFQALTAVVFHILGALFLLFVTGLTTPFINCWILLLIASSLYFGFKAYVMSILFMFFVTFVNLMVHGSTMSSQDGINSVVAVISLAVIGFIISEVLYMSEMERQAYERSRHKEFLQHERLTALVNAMGDAVINTDAHGHIRFYNAAALSLLDTNVSLSGRHIDDFLHLQDEQKKTVKLSKLSAGTDRAFNRRDLTLSYKDSEQANIYVNASPIRGSFGTKRPSTLGHIYIMRDITKEKSLEEERDEFISVVSHELRTPVAIAEGSLSNASLMLERNIKTEKLPQILAESYEQITYLSKMINDLSTLSRAERGVADETEDIDVRDLLQNLYAEYQPQANAKDLRLNIELAANLGKVHASKLYLEEVLQNFITNAIKYTPSGDILIRAELMQDDVVFSVKDSGIGMSKSDQNKIFDKFYRSEDYRTRETNGTGLGLYVVSKLAAKLKTKISVSSRLNHGSTFSFRLPKSLVAPKND